MSAQGSFTSYNGYVKDIPADASPGLQFLAVWIKTFDCLDQKNAPVNLVKLLAPSASFIMNVGDPVPGSQMPQMLERREKMMSAFSRGAAPIAAFDLEHSSGRTLICELISSSIFKQDPEQEAVTVKEVVIIQLVAAPEGEGYGGLWVSEAKIYEDRSAVINKVKAVMSMSQKQP